MKYRHMALEWARSRPVFFFAGRVFAEVVGVVILRVCSQFPEVLVKPVVNVVSV